MFTRRFKTAFARVCIALLCLQAAVAAYACPAFLADLEAAAKVAAHSGHAEHAMAPSGDCEQQHPAGDAAGKNMCHQHYSGEQSVGAGTLASATAAPTLPLAFVTLIEPAAPAGSIVLAALLQRNTAPPLSIQFQVLRI